MADRAYSSDERHQRSFVFSFDYYTVIGRDCTPMGWQLKDIVPKKRDEHIPISKCNSVVALSLSGNYIRKTKNAHRRAKTEEGYIYDPWAPVGNSSSQGKEKRLTKASFSGMYLTSSVIRTISIVWTVMIRRSIMSMGQRHS